MNSETKFVIVVGDETPRRRIETINSFDCELRVIIVI